MFALMTPFILTLPSDRNNHCMITRSNITYIVPLDMNPFHVVNRIIRPILESIIVTQTLKPDWDIYYIVRSLLLIVGIVALFFDITRYKIMIYFYLLRKSSNPLLDTCFPFANIWCERELQIYFPSFHFSSLKNSGEEMVSLSRTSIFYDARMLNHVNLTDKDHPESPSRIESTYQKLFSSNLISRMVRCTATINEPVADLIKLCHSSRHLDEMRRTHGIFRCVFH